MIKAEFSKEQHLSEIKSFCDIKHYRSKVWRSVRSFILFFEGEINKIN